MEDKLIIAFSGKKRCGKNSAALFAKNFFMECGRTVEEMAFADPVKKSLALAMGLNESHFFQDEAKSEVFSFYDGQKMTGREMLQKFGTEALRDNFNDSIWLTSTVNKIKKSTADVILITDLRFPNELDFLREQGAFSIRIRRGDIIDNDTHYSETALDSECFDFFINNDEGKMSFLQSEIRSILNVIINL